MRARFPGLIVLVLGLALILPVSGFPGAGPRPIPTRMQTLSLSDIAVAGGRGMSGVENPTASRSSVVQTEPFRLLGLSWESPPPEGSVVKVRVREETGWTPWMAVPFEVDHGPDPDTAEGAQARTGTDPVLTDTSDAVQVWVQTPDGQAPEDAQIHLVDTDDVDLQAAPMSQAAAAPGRPPIITRAQWGADESQRNRDPVYSKVVKVGFVHHTVSSSTYTPEQAAAQMRNLYAWYTEGLKYSDMAYNFLVDRFGRLYEGRAGGMDRPVVGGHTAGLNTDSFAVSAMGNFQEFNPASGDMAKIKESIAQLMAWKLGLSKRDPGGKDKLVSNGSLGSGFWEAGEVATLNRVSGHQDAGNTACPGKYLYAQVPDIRARAAAIFRGGGAEPAPDVPDLVTPDPVTSEFSFRGSGSGDGVGVPRAGVLGQARDGRKAARILKHYLDGVAVGSVADGKVIRMALGSGDSLALDSQSLTSGGGGFAVGSVRGTAKTVMRARVADGVVVIERKQGKSWQTVSSGAKATVRWAGTRSAGKLGSRATAMRIGSDVLRQGTVTLTPAGSAVRAVANLRVRDEYLPYLNAPGAWPEQGMRAMAIAARSKALTYSWNPDCGCHVTDSGFGGQKNAATKTQAAWRKAVASTARGTDSGLAVTYQGKPVDVPLFEASGGATLNASEVRESDVPYARSADDPWSLKPKNSEYAIWKPQTRPQADVAELFDLPDVVQLDLSNRLTGGAVAKAVATSSSGKTASISGEKLRTALSLPSAFIARSASPQPTSATSLSASLSAGRGSPVVVQASDTSVVALASAFAGVAGRPLRVMPGSGPDAAARKALRSARSITVVGTFPAGGLKALSRLAKVNRVTAPNAAALSLTLAARVKQSSRRPVFVVPAGNTAAMASAAMGAVRSRGYLLAVGKQPSQAMVKWVGANGKRSIVVASKKELPNSAVGTLRRPARIGAEDPVVRSARIAALGSRRGEAVLVDSRRVMAAAAAAASGRAVLLVAKTGNRGALRFLQASPAISTLRTVGAPAAVVSAARRA